MIRTGFPIATLALAFTVAAGVARAGESYLALEGGAQFWPDTSNNNELEAGAQAGLMVGAALGARTAALGFSSRIELEAAHRSNDSHGRNGPGCNRDHCRADGLSDNDMNAMSLMVNLWPEVNWQDFSLYAGGGVGAAYATAFDDDTITPAAQIGAGAIWHWQALEADLGYRYWSTAPLQLDRQDGRYYTHGPMLRLTWHFGQ
jgi:opacity protein-like surface antigen